MRLELSGLKMPYKLEADFEVPDLAENARSSGGFHFAAVIEGDASSAKVTGAITGAVILECSRCLGETKWPILIDLDLSYLAREAFMVEDGHQLTPEELESDEIVDGGIEIGELVREQIILALPQQFVCSEDCPGLCTVCGAELKFGDCGCQREMPDPRWDALRNLN
jgi:uncharacterized protein